MNEHALNKILDALCGIQQAESVAEALNGVALAVSLMSGASSAAVYLDDAEAKLSGIVAIHGNKTLFTGAMKLPTKLVQSLTPNSILDWQTLPGELATIADTISDDSLWFRLGTESRVVGTVIVADFSNPPQSETRQILLQTGLFAARQVDNLAIFDHLQSRVAALTDLYEVGKVITSTLDVDSVLNQIVQTVARLVDATRCSIMLLNEAGDELRIRSAVGIPADVIKSATRKVGEGISGKVAQTGEALFLRNIKTEAGGATSSSGNYKSASLISVPLCARGVVIGVVNVNDRGDGGDFSEEDMNLVMLFASQAAIAIDNANLRAKLWMKSVTDGLTQTFVHSYFMSELERMVAEAAKTGKPLAVIMTDLDHFKVVNDTWGHPAGDEILVSLASIMHGVVRAGDLVARYGGEEFVVILSGVSPRGVVRVAERIRKTVEMTDFAVIDHHKVTTSVGIGMFPFDGTTAKELIGAADKHLYVSKASGRNMVNASEEVMNATRPTEAEYAQ